MSTASGRRRPLLPLTLTAVGVVYGDIGTSPLYALRECFFGSHPVPPTHENVPYGKHERQVLDFYQAKSDAPTPVVFAIHGGGWVNGDKSGYRNGARRYLDAGISVVAINYRYTTQAAEAKVEPPVKWPLEDAARAQEDLSARRTTGNLLLLLG